MRSLELGGGAPQLEFVHPKYPELFGRRTVPTLRELDKPVDLAFVMVGPNRVGQILEDAAAAGIRNAVTLAAGYTEAGEEGRELQDALRRQAEDLDITLMGPNTIGFINATLGIAPWAVASHRAPIPGAVSAVFESGSMCRAAYEYTQAHAIGISHWVSLGNSAVMNTLDVLEYLIDEPSTRSIALFLETVRDPERFIPLAHRALAADKPVVVYKAGRSEEGMRAAMAHTGAMATNDAVVDSAFRQAGIVRVESLEELVATAGLLGHTRRRPVGRRMGVVTSSGGGCNVIADLAHREGLSLPPWSEPIVADLQVHLPPFAHTLNPLDTTGFGHARARPRPTKAEDDLMEIAVREPGIDFMFTMMTPLPSERPADPAFIESRMAIIGDIVKASPVPVFLASNTNLDVTDYARKLLHDNDLHLLPGVDLALRSIGYMLTWCDRRTSILDRGPISERIDPPGVVGPAGTWDEWEGRQLLQHGRIPVVPARLVTTAEDAVAAAAELGDTVVLKVCSADIPHKSDVGGVALGLSGAAEVADGYRRVTANAAVRVPGASVRGVLVSPMRPAAPELLVGVTVDPTFGPVLTVAFGGIWVETLKDSSLRVLPVSRPEIRDMLFELKGITMLTGGRGAAAADLDAVIDAINDIAAAAVSLGPDLVAFEVNPLRVGAAGPEALDVLIVTEER
ncbi:acetate--CoA ligase family protein [Nakamurella alba]|nr:acetate--CoA ligase family protein [Nakamurella alba]